jgi:hypothetical protein
MTTMVVAPLEWFGVLSDMVFELPYYLYDGVRKLGWLVRVHWRYGLAMTFVFVCSLGVQLWNVLTGMAIGAIAGVRGRRVYSVNHGDITVSDGGNGSDDSPKPLEECVGSFVTTAEDSQAMYQEHMAKLGS